MMSFVARRTLLGWMSGAATLATLGATTARAQAPTIKIGGIGFLSGKYGTYGLQVGRGMEIAAKQINEAGGLLGTRIELDIQDTASDAAQAISLLRRFSSSPDVFGIVGPIGTPDLLAILPLSPQAGLPIVSVASSTDLPPNRFGKWLVRISLRETYDLLKDVLARVGKARGIRTIGMLQDRTNDFAQAESNTVRKILGEGGGMKLVGDEVFANGDKDFAAVIDKVTREKPDAVWLAGFVNEVSLIMQQARARGYAGLFVGGGGLTDPTIAKIAGAAAVGTVTFLPFNSGSDAPLIRRLAAGYKADGGEGDVPTYTAYGFDGVTMLANAARTANSLDRTKVMDALGATRDLQLTTGLYSYAGKGDNVAPPSPFLVEVTASGSFAALRE